MINGHPTFALESPLEHQYLCDSLEYMRHCQFGERKQDERGDTCLRLETE